MHRIDCSAHLGELLHSKLGSDARASVREVLGLCWLVVIATVSQASTAQSRERVLMPWTCNLDNGRLRVEPSSEQSYAVIGAREQQSHAACFGPDANRCKTWMIHRFAVVCQGGRVPWVDIVAATARDRNRISLDSGALVVRTGPRQGAFVGRDCAAFGRAPWRAPLASVDCAWTADGFMPRQPRAQAVMLPRGFAPLSLAGARLVFEADAVVKPKATVATPSVTIHDVEPLPVSTVAAFASQALSPPTVGKTQPVVTVSPPHTPEYPPKRPTWSTNVEPVVFTVPDHRAVATGPQTWPQAMELLTLAAAILAASTALFLRQRRQFVPFRRQGSGGEPGAGLPGSPDGQRASALQLRANSQMLQIRSALERLEAVPPLRNALARELTGSERRLSTVLATTVSKETADLETWRRACNRMERVVHDLDRLQQITDGAVTSLTGLTQNRSLPRDVAEAYAVLGVNQGVSDSILKKLVDALRVSWHPDLATSDEDRTLRDIRIKEINVAWDLITGKRSVA